MNDILVIIGNGGHTQDILGVLKANYKERPNTVIIDDDRNKSEIDGTNIVDMYLKLMRQTAGKKMSYVIGVNSSQIRKEIAGRMDAIYAIPADPIIHPQSIFNRYNTPIGPGSVIGAGVVMTTNVKLGAHCHINSCASINQGSTIGHFATLAPGARICGDVYVGDNVMMGCNSSIINMINIGDDAVIGAGAVVIRDVKAGQTVIGVPAKPMEEKLK